MPPLVRVPADRAGAIDVILQYGLQHGCLNFAGGAAQEFTRAAIAQYAVGQKLVPLVINRQPPFEVISMRQQSGSSIEIVSTGGRLFDVHGLALGVRDEKIAARAALARPQNAQVLTDRRP